MDDRERFLKSLVGMTKSSACAFIDGAGLKCRTMHIEGKPCLGAANLDMNRVNLHIESGLVVKAYFG